MKIKAVFLFLLLSNLNNYCSEIRLDAMSARSNSLYFIQDIWCDSFYNNPAYSSENNKIIINSFFYNSFLLDNNTGNSENNYYYTHVDRSNSLSITFNPNLYFGILIPINIFSLGANLKYTHYYYKSEYQSYEYDEYDDKHDNYNSTNINYYNIIQGDLLLSWKINNIVNIGFITKFKYLLNYYNETKVDQRSGEFGKTPYDFTTDNKLGILIKQNSIKISISVPFIFNYIEYRDINLYNSSEKDWYYIKYSYNYQTAINSIFDIIISDWLSLRIQADLGLYITETTRHYTYLSPENKNIHSNNDYKLIKYSYPFKAGISFNNKIKNNGLLFYGIDFGFQPDFEKEKITNIDHEQKISIYSEIFFGCEINIIDWFGLRIGTITKLIDYSNYLIVEKNPSVNTYSYPNSYTIGKSNITIGFLFKPSKSCNIEINTSLLNINFKNNSNEYHYSDYDYQSNSKNMTLKIDFGLYFEIDYNKKLNHDEVKTLDDSKNKNDTKIENN